MAQLAMGLAGAAIGTAIGGTATGLGQSLGWTIGVALGGVLFSEGGPDVNQEGSRLDDLRVTSSAYGQAVADIYGTVPVPGNIIQSSEIYEHVYTNKQSSGGKGGGGQTVTTTSYSYDVDLAVALCEGPIFSVIQIFANEQLIFDASESAEAVQPDWLKFRVYKGTEDQDVDPTLEALTGDLTPAYRGVAYVVFDKFQLAGFNNSIPNFRFVVSKVGSSQKSVTLIDNPIGSNGSEHYGFHYGTCIAWDEENQIIWTGCCPDNIADYEYQIVGYDPYTKQIVRLLPYVSQYEENVQATARKIWKMNLDGRPVIALMTNVAYASSNRRLMYLDTTTGQLLAESIGPMSITDAKKNARISSLWPDFLTIVSNGVVRQYNPNAVFEGVGGTMSGYMELKPNTGDWSTDWNMDVIATDEERGRTMVAGIDKSGSEAGLKVWLFKALWPTVTSTGVVYDVEFFSDPGVVVDITTEIENITQDSIYSATSAVYVEEAVWDSVEQCFWLSLEKNNALIFVQVFEDGSVGRIVDTRPLLGNNTGLCSVCGNMRLQFISTTGKFYWWYASNHVAFDIRNKTFDIVYDVNKPHSEDDDYSMGGAGFYFSNTDEVWSTRGWTLNGNVNYYKRGAAVLRRSGYSVSTIPLKTIIDGIMNKANYDSSEYDSAELTSVIEGYRVTSVQSARAALLPLANYGKFDIVDSEGKIKFRTRGKNSIVAIPEEDLAARYQDDKSMRKLEKRRAHETSLPKSLSVKYLDKELNYEVGNQRAQRIASLSKSEATIDLPIVLTYENAAKFADIDLHLRHIERMTYSFSIPYEYAYLEPGDVIDVMADAAVYRIRITQMDMDRGVIKVQGVADLKSAYSSSAIGQTSLGAPKAVIAATGLTKIATMNLPAMRDAELGYPYWFVGAYGTSSGWKGGGVYEETSIDEYTLAYHLNAKSTVGILTHKPFHTPLYPDTTNAYEVILSSGTLESITLAQFQVGGVNYAALRASNGRNEVIAFKDATLISANKWSLKTVSRGLFGTEQLVDSGSAIEFVLLDESSIGRVQLEEADINIQKSLRSVSDGSYVYGDNVLDQTFTPKAQNLVPFAPAQTHATFEVNGDVTITWTARDRRRIKAFWSSATTIDPLNFEIDMLDQSGNVLNTYFVTDAQTFTYLSANRITDYGDTVEYIYARIYQISDVAAVGRGYGAYLKAHNGAPAFVKGIGTYNLGATSADNMLDGNVETEHATALANTLSVVFNEYLQGRYVSAIRLKPHSNVAYRPTSVELDINYRVNFVDQHLYLTIDIAPGGDWQVIELPNASVVLAINGTNTSSSENGVNRVNMRSPVGAVGSYGFAEVEFGYLDY